MVVDVYEERFVQHSLGREHYYCKASVIHECGTRSALSWFVNMLRVKGLVRFMAHSLETALGGSRWEHEHRILLKVLLNERTVLLPLSLYFIKGEYFLSCGKPHGDYSLVP